MRCLIVIASVSTASVPAVRSHDAAPVSILSEAKANRPASAPVLVAQGRCYNGRCY
jgi:hypothetical protein